MIVGTTYAEVKKVALDNGLLRKERTFYTTSSDLISLLDYFNFKVKRGGEVSHRSSIQCVSIVAINFRETRNLWHWVVYIPDYNQGYVLDPHMKIKKEQRIDLSRMRLKSYIPIDSI